MWTRTYLFLKSEGDASDGSLLDSLHQVSREAGDLVSESLGLDLTDVINDSLIYMEVVGQPRQDTKTRSFRSAHGATRSRDRLFGSDIAVTYFP